MAKKECNDLPISSLNEAICKYKKSPKKMIVICRSKAFDYLNDCTDGVVGRNHIYYRIGNVIYVIYYALTDDARFEILEIRAVD